MDKSSARNVLVVIVFLDQDDLNSVLVGFLVDDEPDDQGKDQEDQADSQVLNHRLP